MKHKYFQDFQPITHTFEFSQRKMPATVTNNKATQLRAKEIAKKNNFKLKVNM
jgi:hypothetical protein